MIKIIDKYSFILYSIIFSIAYRLLIIKVVLIVIPFLVLFGILYGLSFYGAVWSYRKYAVATNSLRNIGVEIIWIIILYCLFPLSWMFDAHKHPYLIFVTFGVISTAIFITILFFLKKLQYILLALIAFGVPILIHILLTNNDAENWVPFLKLVIPAWIIFNGVFFQLFFLKLTKEDSGNQESR